MKTINQIDIAEHLKVSRPYISNLVNAVKRPSWKRAKQLANFTGTTPELWLEGTTEQIKKALSGDLD